LRLGSSALLFQCYASVDAAHYSALQCVAVRCSALQCVAVRCSALQCVPASNKIAIGIIGIVVPALNMLIPPEFESRHTKT